MLDWNPTIRPSDLADLFDRLIRAFRTIPLSKSIKSLPNGDPIALTSVVGGTLVPHGCKGSPVDVTAQIVGNASSTAIVTVGAITPTHVRLYSTATATVHLTVWL